MFYSRSCLCIVALLVLAFPLSAQDAPSPEIPGIRSFNEGKYKLAIGELKTALQKAPLKNDARVWNILGMSYYETGNFKEAAKAYTKAKKIVPTNPAFRTNLAAALAQSGNLRKAKSEVNGVLKSHPIFREALFFRGILALAESDLSLAEKDAGVLIAHHPTHSAGYDLMQRAKLAQIKLKPTISDRLVEEGEKIEEAKAWCDKGLANVTDNDSKNWLKTRSDELGVVIEHIEKIGVRAEGNGATPDQTDPSKTPLKIVSKARPGYTDRARRAGKSGTITLLVMFSSNGKIGLVLPLNSLGHGLDENTVEAARKIVFEPATVNGEPITQIRRIEYSFTIY